MKNRSRFSIKDVNENIHAQELYSPILELKVKMRDILREAEYTKSTLRAAESRFWFEMGKKFETLKSGSWSWNYDTCEFTPEEDEERSRLDKILGLDDL